MKILILMGRFGMGHYSVANALYEQITNQVPEAQVFVQDFFEFAMPRKYKKMYQGYSFLVKRGSKIYNTVYKQTEKTGKNAWLPAKSILLNSVRLLLNKTGADVVISVLPICAQLMAEYKREMGIKLLLITCITDITSHCEWLREETDFYLVPAQCVKDDLIEKGVLDKKIAVSGIPVSEKFNINRTEKYHREKHILIMGGGLGIIPKDHEFYEKLDCIPNVKITVITGNNRGLYRTLKGKFENIRVVGYTQSVAEYMTQADLVLSKPGGITLFETIYAEVPILVLAPFLEQEVKNGMFIRRRQVGIVLQGRSKQCVQEIAQIIRDENALEQIRRNMKQLKRELNRSALSELLSAYQEVLV